MARTTITFTTPNIPYPVLPVTALSADVALQAMSGSSGANGNQIAFGNFNTLLVIFQNTAVGAQTVTISSIATSQINNRTGDITAYSLAATFVSAFMVPANGFKQADGMLYLESNSASMKCAVIGIN